MSNVEINQTAEGQKICITFDEDDSDAIANGELVRLVRGTDFDDEIRDSRSVIEISLTTSFSE